jgi:hypothetical protein
MNSMPVIGTRCSVGRIPNTPQKAAGHWIDPLVSPAMSNGARPAATATAGPVEEPPAVRSAFRGFSVGGKTLSSPHRHGPFVLPTMIAPAAFSLATTVASAAGTCSAKGR